MKSTNRGPKTADRPKPAETVCPGCDLIRGSWPERGYVHAGPPVLLSGLCGRIQVLLRGQPPRRCSFLKKSEGQCV